jgi:hypothetical protein
MTNPAPKPRWYRLTPDRLILALLAVQGPLWLSDRLGWPAWHKGYAVLTAVASVGAAFLAMLLWLAASLIFRWRFQFSIRSLLVLVVVVAIPCSWLAAGHRRGTSTLHAADQFPRKMARLSLARALCFVHHGRALFVGGGAVCGVESRSGEARRACPPVALEQREGALVRPRRPVGQSGAVIVDGRRLESLLEECDKGGGTARFARTRANGSALGQCGVLGSFGKSCWPHPEAAETRPKAKTTQGTNKKKRELGNVSPEP